MNGRDLSKPVRLTLPSSKEYVLVAGMALSAFGMLAGLDADLIGDLRTVSDECMDCLSHQPGNPAEIEVQAWVGEKRLHVRFHARQHAFDGSQDELGLEVTRAVLETLMPDVRLEMDEGGVCGIECSMPL